MGFASGYMQMHAARRAAHEEARIREEEARVTARAMRLNAQQEIGRMKADVASRGIQLSGTSLDIVAHNAGVMEREALDVEKYGAQMADLARMGGRQFGRAATVGAIGGILSTGATVYTAAKTLSGG